MELRVSSSLVLSTICRDVAWRIWVGRAHIVGFARAKDAVLRDADKDMSGV